MDTGRWDISAAVASEISTLGARRARVAAVQTHPQYNTNTQAYDVAVLTLDATEPGAAVMGLVSAGSNIAPAGTSAITSGWGGLQQVNNNVQAQTFPQRLRQVSVPVISQTSCAAAVSQYNSISMICAGDLARGGVDSCQGDSGGPIFVPAAGGFIQIGTVSVGVGCALAGNPGVYSNLASGALRSFVDSAVAGSGGVASVSTSNNNAVSASTSTSTTATTGTVTTAAGTPTPLSASTAYYGTSGGGGSSSDGAAIGGGIGGAVAGLALIGIAAGYFLTRANSTRGSRTASAEPRRHRDGRRRSRGGRSRRSSRYDDASDASTARSAASENSSWSRSSSRSRRGYRSDNYV